MIIFLLGQINASASSSSPSDTHEKWPAIAPLFLHQSDTPVHLFIAHVSCIPLTVAGKMIALAAVSHSSRSGNCMARFTLIIPAVAAQSLARPAVIHRAKAKRHVQPAPPAFPAHLRSVLRPVVHTREKWRIPFLIEHVIATEGRVNK